MALAPRTKATPISGEVMPEPTFDEPISLNEFFDEIAKLSMRFNLTDVQLVAALGACAGNIAGFHIKKGCCEQALFDANLTINYTDQINQVCGDATERSIKWH
jgi:hypothetical protein